MLPSASRYSLDATPSSGGWSSPVAARRVFIAILLVTCLVHAVTLTRSPPAWQDEIQEIDYGRTFWPGSDQSYGVNWNAKNRPSRPLPYVGCLIQEAAYRTASGSIAGPRVSTLAGAIIAAIALRSWLLAAGISPWIALVASCGFLWDPLVVAGYRGARVDVWCMAFMFGALWCIRRSPLSRHSFPVLALAGALVAASGLTWASAILLLPLILYELYVSAVAFAATSGKQTNQLLPAEFLGSTLIVGTSAAATLLLLLLPFYAILGTMVADLRNFVSHEIANEQNKLVASVWTIPRIFLVSPWLPLIALGGVAILGPRSLFLPLTAAVCGVVVTSNYSHRAVYLMPYFAYGFAMAAEHIKRSSESRLLFRNPATWLAAIVLMWGCAISLVARTLNTLNEWERRDPALVERFIDDLAGGSKTKVLLGSWNLYYPVRSRGWRYWGPADSRPTADLAASLDYDYVIHDESKGIHRLDGALQAAGYTRRVIRVCDWKPSGWNLFSQGTRAYGPYVVYTRPDLPTAVNEPE